MKKKTVSDLKLFNEFLNSEEEERNIENIPAAELQQDEKRKCKEEREIQIFLKKQ